MSIEPLKRKRGRPRTVRETDQGQVQPSPLASTAAPTPALVVESSVPDPPTEAPQDWQAQIADAQNLLVQRLINLALHDDNASVALDAIKTLQAMAGTTKSPKDEPAESGSLFLMPSEANPKFS